MTVQPTYHWEFSEREGSVTKDRISGVEANMVRCSLQLHGRIGNAIHVNGKNGALYLGKEAGQFGTDDFTIAFGMVVLGRHDDNNLDIIGTRSSKSHGNWVSLLLLGKKRLSFEVDENSKGKNYFTIETEEIIDDHSWHHITLVREGLTLRIYVDGELKAEGVAPGIANINNDADMKVGDWLRDTPTARYEDLRIYHGTALNGAQIQSLIPPVKPILHSGQIELVATDQATIILTEDDTDLTRYSEQFQSLRLGPDTGVTLYRGNNFDGVSQKVYADIPDIRTTRVDAFPKSIQIWSSIGTPFTGKWIISAGNGHYLHQNKQMLELSEQHLSDGFFSFHYNPTTHQTLLVPANNIEMPLLKVGNHNASMLVVDDSEFEQASFSIVHSAGDQWLTLVDGTLNWTEEHERRTLFYRVIMIADNEGQVGEISEGEVALYQHSSYHGKAWVLSDYEPGIKGNYISLKDFHGLNNTISSIRVGPDTGVTLFANEQQRVDEGKEQTQQEDIVDNVSNMGETQIRHDNASSLQIFRIVKPETLFTSVTSRLSQDYRMIGDKLEEFSSYRTTLRLSPEVTEIEVSATDLITIEVEGELYHIDEVNSVKLSPNLLQQIMITSEADGLSTPGLKFHASKMAKNARVVIFPDQEVHKQIAELEDDALWNATDVKGNRIIDQNKHSRDEISAVQNTIKRTMATVVDTPDDSATPNAATAPVALTNLKSVNGFRQVASAKQFVSVKTIENPWTLNLQPRPDTDTIPNGSARRKSTSVSIWEEPLDRNSFEQMSAQAEVPVTPGAFSGASIVDGNFAARSARKFFENIGDAIKGAAKVSLGVLDGALNALIEIGGQIVRFVLDTAKKVADFVQAVIEQVVESIKQFIEFLQFIFDWDDILDTKRFLVETINNAMDSVSDMVESAKEPVSEFFDTLQEGLDDGADKLIDLLGVNPDKEQNGGFELPEAAEWFLTKILAGNGKAVVDEVTDTATQELSNILEDLTGFELPPVAQAFLDIIKQIQSFSEIETKIRDEVLVEIAESLIANPLRPELVVVGIIEALRTVASDLVDTAEDIALTFLDIIIAAIDGLKDLLNTNINIPLLSALFDLIGAGDLTILNLTSMLIAIPATIISKLFFNEAPFKDMPQPVFPTSSALVSVLADEAESGVEESESKVDEEKQRRMVIGFGVIGITADLLNGIISTGLDLIPEIVDEILEPETGHIETMSLVLSGVSWLASFPASRVEPGGYPYNLCHKDNKVDIHNNTQEFWERVMWGWRSFTLALDISYVIAAFGIEKANLGAGSKVVRAIFQMQRLSRGTKYTAILTTGLTVVDMIVTGIYLTTIPKKDKVGREIANEFMGFLPTLCCYMRQTVNPYLWLALFGINVTSTFVTTGLNIAMLVDDVKEFGADE